jgi:tetratricopeptide (TPR) repeat protein
MKVALFVCVMVATASAAPRYGRSTRLDPKLSEHVRAAEQAWAVAEREPDAKQQLVLWEQAATAFGEVDGDAVDAKVKRDAAYAAVLAWKNALAVDVKIKSPDVSVEPAPKQLPARELKLIAVIDRYATYAVDTDPDLPGLLFLAAQLYIRFDQLETAIPKLRAIVDRYPQHEVGGYAANLVLDSYNRLRRYDDLIAYAATLAADDKLVRAHPDVAALVGKLQNRAKRKHVEALEATARATHDLGTYVAVGTAYLELYNADPKTPEGDELLYNAGIAFETAHSTAAAIQAFELVRRQYARSKVAARALARLGRTYGDVAMYAEAADKLEQYAKQYAGEKDAFDAMSDAVLFRKALGDRDKAIADTDYIVKLYGAKKPHEIADAVWSLTALFDAEPDRAIAQLRDYLITFAAKGDAARVVIAHAKIGQLLWKQSCRLPGVDGLCVTTNEHAARTCGTGTTQTATVTARDPRKRTDALAELAAAIQAYERQPKDGDLAARYYYAQAKLAVADDELETYLALAVPRGLQFDADRSAVRDASVKRFGAWVEHEQRSGASLTRAYEAVLAVKDAASSITAAARIGIVAQGFASSLVTGTGPHAADKLAAYCDKMTELAEPLEARAADAFAVCLAKSSELGWFGASSALCERVLSLMKPVQFPRARELRAEALHVAPVIAIEPALP